MENAATATTQAGQEPGGPWISGIIPPVCTPFNPELEVDVASLERLLGFLIEQGVSGVFVLGSSGETAYLTDAQRDVVVEVAVKTVSGQVPVLAGLIDMTTNRMIEHAGRALGLGADALVATAPFYAQVTEPPEVERHFRALKAATGAPLLAYDIPVAVHSKLGPRELVTLAGDHVIDGLKDSSGDIAGMREVIVGTRSWPKFATFTGSEAIVDCAVQVGASGAVPGLGNVDPGGFVELYRTCRAGEWDKARSQQERLMTVFEVTRCAKPGKGRSAAGLGGFKTALMLRGIIATNLMASPQAALDEEETAAVRRVLVTTGLL
ncbi:MAG TPA: dihydrodipicolinate synthase family protein [Acidimicrobiales bacterium]|nr:dihydrodipicolinate synthase family protein [Acidimicrobiales bacterium]